VSGESDSGDASSVVATTSMPTLVHRNRRRPGSACPSNSKDDEDGTDGGDFDEGSVHPASNSTDDEDDADGDFDKGSACPLSDSTDDEDGTNDDIDEDTDASNSNPAESW
jgi:hypothetical protein